MDLSFVILTWNSESYIEKCFDSLMNSLAASAYSSEIFIVDNGSSDGTVAILKNYQEQYGNILKLIFLDKNVGTTVSRNMALKQATGDYIVIMDSDIELPEGIFDTLIRSISKNSKIGMVVPQIVYPSGKWQKSIDQFPTLLHKLNRFFRLRSIEDKEGCEEVDSLSERTVDYAISAFWLFKKEVLENVGLLDENYFYAPEDVDYCLQIWKAGFKIVYVPTVTVVHHTQEISRGFKINKAKLEHIKGLIYLYRKYRFLFSSPRLGLDRKNALFITYQFPPIAGAATQRHLRFLSRISEFSWFPIVLTVCPDKVTEYVQVDNSLICPDVSKNHTIRATSFNPLEYMLTLKKKLTNSCQKNISQIQKNKTSEERVSKSQILKDLITELFRIPDMMNGWYPFAVVKGIYGIYKFKCQVVYASGGPWTALLVGVTISSMARKPLICDFRDPWLSNPYRKKKYRLFESIERYLEKQVILKSSYVIANTQRLLVDFKKTYPNVSEDKFVHIGNGYDERNFSNIIEEDSFLDHKLVVRHVGSLYGPRSPVVLLRVLSELKKQGVITCKNFLLEFIGRINADCLQQDFLEKLGIQDIVKISPPVPHEHAIRAIQQSDVLLIIQPDTTLQIPGKLFEYIAAAKPVLALACDGATADLVLNEKLGLVSEVDDEDRLKQIIAVLMKMKNEGTLSELHAPDNPYKFESRELTRKLTSLFDYLV